MTPNIECSRVEESYVTPKGKITKRRKRTGKNRSNGAVSKNIAKAPLSRPAQSPSPKEPLYDSSFFVGDGPQSVCDLMEDEINRARSDIFTYCAHLKLKRDFDDKFWTMVMEKIVSRSLPNIGSEERSPQNEFVINSLIGNFEEKIGEIGQEAMDDMIETTDGIRRILVRLVKRIQRSFRPKVHITATTVVKLAASETLQFFWKGLLTICALLICVFPDYLPRAVVSAAAFYQSAFLAFILFCILYFYNPPRK